MRRLALLFFCFILITPAARAAGNSVSYYQRAFDAVDASNAAQVESYASHGPNTVLNKVLRSYAMAMPGNDYTFDQLNAFMTENPGWPCLKNIQMIAEQKMPPLSASQIVSWYSVRKPLTLVGFYRYIDALNQSGSGVEAQKVIRARWIEGDFNNEEQIAFFARFASLLTNEDVWARADRLLWKNEQTQTRHLMPFLTPSDRAVAEARLAFASQSGSANSLASRVPPDAQNDPGLLFQRLKAFVKKNEDDDADEILLNAPADLGNAEAWWDQRSIMVRRAIENRDYALAYRLASNHGQTDPKTLSQAEFMSGWLALRFLNNPDIALQHFQNLYDNAATPISRARGAYWLGRTHEELGEKEDARQFYEDAAGFNTIYYGQLAAARLYTAPILSAKNDPPVPDSARQAFMAQDRIRAIEKLAEVGEMDRARGFFHVAIDNATKRTDFVLLAEISQHIHSPDLGIQAVKAANQKNIFILNGAFPVIRLHVPTPPEPAFTHALVRQESTFNPDATSSAGARGLMQLMPRTAKDICKKVGLRWKEKNLEQPSYNLQLGTAFVAQQIEHFDGSYVLALAGYNAGPARVREWIARYGDPRNPNVDPIDWIESIPIQETRNYVQRIIESLQVYRAKLSGGQARLLIINDLKR